MDFIHFIDDPNSTARLDLMLTTSFQTRGVNFAFLAGPPRTLGRQDGMRIHSAVCERLGADDISFKFSPGIEPPGAGQAPSRQSRGFAINFERPLGRGSLQITIDNPSVESPVRVLAQYAFPPSREHVREDLDLAFAAIFDELGDGWQKVLAEARIRGQLEARGGSALAFMTGDVLNLPLGQETDWGEVLSFAGIRIETAAGDPSEGDSLANPKREVNVEVLREDPKCLYVELMCQWPQLASSSGSTVHIDSRRIRTFDDPPSTYLRAGQDWLMNVALPQLHSGE